MKPLFFKYITLAISLLSATAIWAQSQTFSHARYGGSADDYGNCIIPNPDGSFLLVGNTESNNGQVVGNQGDSDGWIAKINASGDLLWQKCMGGSGFDSFRDGVRLADGGYTLVGLTGSNDGDVSGNNGLRDAWVVRIDSVGTLIWQRCLGGSDNDQASRVLLCSDGGFLVNGLTWSSDGDGEGQHGFFDAMVLKLSADGNTQWRRVTGGSAIDNLISALELEDGSFLLVGETGSSNGDVTGPRQGNTDGWLMKLSASGAIADQKYFGGNGPDAIYKIIQKPAGGYYVAGTTISSNLPSFNGSLDIWLLSLNEQLELEWQKCLGGNRAESLADFVQMPDGSLTILGSAEGNGGMVTGYKGGQGDAWMVNVGADGVFNWQSCIGGTNYDLLQNLQFNASGQLVSFGYTRSTNSGLGSPKGMNDFWMVKLNTVTNVATHSNSGPVIFAFPNPATDVMHVSLPIDQVVSAEWVDALGRSYPIAIIHENNALDVRHLPSGFYWLRLLWPDGKIDQVKCQKQ